MSNIKAFSDSNKNVIYINVKCFNKKREQAGAELGQAQPQLGLRLANVEI